MIRTYKSEDIDRIMEIGNAAWQEIYKMYRELYGDELFDIIVPDEKSKKGKDVKEFIKAHQQWVLVCEEEGCIAGFVTYSLDYDKKIGTIGNNAVDLNFRQKGIGQQMYKATLEQFRKEGMLYANVHTGMDYAHAPARRAYERAGFNIRHEDVNYYMKL